ncbi:hypothetical protein HOLleu_26664 [Holothuria leucospilota]|uniref:DUF6570 domain-containing protein n=1 Tax=Holothuria leucospilota TaxID=206669 RepID=A0A9Q1H080_HOLLE|nr:hypothetical protein HOLleu_26664 [Holothuria leucospilota]
MFVALVNNYGINSVIPAESFKTQQTYLTSAEGKVWIRRTCKQYIDSNKIPPLSKANNTSMSDVSNELNLDSLEERLVALRTPFMQVRELPRGRQLSITGNVVNVSADVTNNIKILPRRIDGSDTIPVKFKRKLTYKHTVWSQSIRTNKILEAANWLVTNSDLYKEEGVTVLNSWSETLNDMKHDWKEFVNIYSFNPPTVANEFQKNVILEDERELKPDSDDELTEVTEENNQPLGSLDTMLSPECTTDGNLAYCLAPSEAAETRWLHLLRILGRTLQNRELSDSEILNMTWQEKSDLIQGDPVTCSRHFDYLVRRFINDVMQSSYHPVEEIIDYFYRVEFQSWCHL